MSRKALTLNDFETTECLGEGAYAKVMRAKLVAEGRKETGKEFAIKILDKQQINRYEKHKYVKIERTVFLECGSHPNIVALHFTFQDEYSLYFVMDLCKNGTLFDKILDFGKLPEDLTRHWIGETILAIEHMHLKGIVHRDLKPENILIYEDRHVRVTDFGTCGYFENFENLQKEQEAKEAEDKDEFDPDSRGRTKSFVGTAEYVAPELLESRVEKLAPLDFWSIGILLYQALVGKTPFKGASEYLTFQRIIEGNLVFPDFVSPDARDVITKLLDVDHQTRLGSGSNGWEDLKSHSFFKGLDWKNLHKADVPPLPETKKESNASAVEVSSVISENLGDPIQLSGCCCCTSKSQYVPGARQCEKLLAADHYILLESVVEIPTCMGICSKTRVMILTTTPRLFLVNPSTLAIDEEFEWSRSLYCNPQGEKLTLNINSSQSISMMLLGTSPGEWAAKINELQNQQRASISQ